MGLIIITTIINIIITIVPMMTATMHDNFINTLLLEIYLSKNFNY